MFFFMLMEAGFPIQGRQLTHYPFITWLKLQFFMCFGHSSDASYSHTHSNYNIDAVKVLDVFHNHLANSCSSNNQIANLLHGDLP